MTQSHQCNPCTAVRALPGREAFSRNRGALTQRLLGNMRRLIRASSLSEKFAQNQTQSFSDERRRKNPEALAQRKGLGHPHAVGRHLVKYERAE